MVEEGWWAEGGLCMKQLATFNVHQYTQLEPAQMFTDQLAPMDSLSIKPNARFAWNIKWLIME